MIPEGGVSAIDAVYLDATFGRGGHTLALLERLPANARLLATDRDPDAIARGRELAAEDSRLSVWHSRFSELGEILERAGVNQIAGAIMDLGVSSPQLDEPQRGFSFRGDGPLDMRMDTSRGETAAQWLDRVPESEIVQVLFTLGEDRWLDVWARMQPADGAMFRDQPAIARAIVAHRPLQSTARLAEIVSAAVPAAARGRRHDATKTFQAIRMQINSELEEITAGLDIIFTRLQIGARLAVISFHSLEDRLVKQTFRRLSSPPQLPRSVPIRAAEATAAARLIGKPVRASEREVALNPRARSATLRVLEKVA